MMAARGSWFACSAALPAIAITSPAISGQAEDWAAAFGGCDRLTGFTRWATGGTGVCLRTLRLSSTTNGVTSRPSASRTPAVLAHHGKSSRSGSCSSRGRRCDEQDDERDKRDPLARGQSGREDRSRKEER